ncbi:MAG: penicillin-binding protein activator [Candidatus Woesearchaeota archaeon]|nr:penicillin-binding protein activator [Candidatus Woesearchaeota archaeon]
MAKTHILIGILLTVVFLTACDSEKQTYKIGAILPLSGANVAYGNEIKNGIDLAVSELNIAGGVQDRSLEVVYEDDATDPKNGVSATHKLIEQDNVPVILGPWASGVALAVAPIAEQNKVILLAEAIAPAISNAGDYIFRIQPSALDYTDKAADFLANKGFKTAGIIFINNDFGVGLKEAFGKSFVAQGKSIVATEAYDTGTQDFRTQLTKIKQKNPEVVFIAGYQETVSVVKQMHELDMNSTVLAGPPFQSKAIIETLGPLAEGVVYPYHLIANTSQARSYENNYFKAYGVQSGGFAPLMYAGVQLLAKILEKCGENTSCIKDELYLTNYEGVSGKITFDQNGDPQIPIVMKTVKNGKFVQVE